MAALDFALGPSSEVIVAGDPQKEDTANMLRAIWSEFIPRKVVLFRPSVEEFPEIADLAKFTRDLQNENGKATTFVCRNRVCNLPTADTLKMLELLDQQ